MPTPTLLCIGHDAAPSRALKKLIFYASGLGYSTDFVILDAGTVAPPSLQLLRAKIENADRVMIGMSTPEPNAFIEIAAARMCVESGTQFGFYSDTHGAWTRPHFRPFWSTADFLCVVNEAEAERAKELFVKSRIVASGNPLWAEFFKPADRALARVAAHTETHEFLILVPGTKNLQHNREFFAPTVTAAAYLNNPHVIFTRRIGDTSPADSYDDIVSRGKERGVRVTMLGEQSDPIVPGADLVINGTSVRVHALARRIPAIDYFTGISQLWLKKDTGSDRGYFFGTGAVIDLYDSDWRHLVHAMQRIKENPKLLEAAQSKLVLKITEEEALSKMFAAMQLA